MGSQSHYNLDPRLLPSHGSLFFLREIEMKRFYSFFTVIAVFFAIAVIGSENAAAQLNVNLTSFTLESGGTELRLVGTTSDTSVNVSWVPPGGPAYATQTSLTLGGDIKEKLVTIPPDLITSGTWAVTVWPFNGTLSQGQTMIVVVP